MEMYLLGYFFIILSLPSCSILVLERNPNKQTLSRVGRFVVLVDHRFVQSASVKSIHEAIRGSHEHIL